MLGENIRRIRNERHLTQSALAEKAAATVARRWNLAIPSIGTVTLFVPGA